MLSVRVFMQPTVSLTLTGLLASVKTPRPKVSRVFLPTLIMVFIFMLFFLIWQSGGFALVLVLVLWLLIGRPGRLKFTLFVLVKVSLL